MSRIRGIEAKVKKEILKDQVTELLANLPELAKNFEIHRKIGEGTFSSVYLGSMRQDATLPECHKKWYAVKHLIPTTHPTRVAHELRCLRDIGGKNYVIGVELCLRNLDHVVFIMPYIPHTKFSEYVGEMDANELRAYMNALLTALRHVHSFGVIHRDVKPSNFLYDRERQRYALVDFGLAQHTSPPVRLPPVQMPPVRPLPAQPPPAHQPLKRMREDDSPLLRAKRMALDLTVRRARSPLPPPNPTPAAAPAPAPPRGCACAGEGGVCGDCALWAPPRANRAGTQGFRPPEVFFKYPHQGTAVDVWAAGVILASVLSGRYPFFRATDDMTALAEITALLGTNAMSRTAESLDLSESLLESIAPFIPTSRFPPPGSGASSSIKNLSESLLESIAPFIPTSRFPPPGSGASSSIKSCRLVTSTRRQGICLRKLSAHLRSAHAAQAPCAHANGAPATCTECRLVLSRCVCLGDTPALSSDPGRTVCGFPDAAFALAARMLDPDPRGRITAANALRHQFFTEPAAGHRTRTAPCTQTTETSK